MDWRVGKVEGSGNRSRLTRENYTIRNKEDDQTAARMSDEEFKSYYDLVMQNFDLNMKFFSSLDHNEFEQELRGFLERNPEFVEVKDLKEYDHKAGYYLLVLDKYCQMYIGTSKDIKSRVRQHWFKRKPFNRLLFPSYAVNTSVLSIDSFKRLDTTRIYAYVTRATFVYEDRLIKSIPWKFLLNRIAGGTLSLFSDIQYRKLTEET